MDRQGYVIRGLQTYNEPDSLLGELPHVNNKHSSEMERVAAHPGIALRRFTPDLYPKEATDMQDYIRRYGHERNLLIADIAHPRGRGEWLSLYRPASRDDFTDQEQRLLTLLMPHLVEALTINRKLALITAGLDSPLSGTRALIRANGAVIHCGARFCELLGDAWAEHRYTRLPSQVLSALQRNGKAMVANGTVLITASRLGNLLLLRAMKMSPLARLSERERSVIQLYAQGSSYKEVARARSLADHHPQLHPARVPQAGHRQQDGSRELAARGRCSEFHGLGGFASGAGDRPAWATRLSLALRRLEVGTTRRHPPCKRVRGDSPRRGHTARCRRRWPDVCRSYSAAVAVESPPRRGLVRSSGNPLPT